MNVPLPRAGINARQLRNIIRRCSHDSVALLSYAVLLSLFSYIYIYVCAFHATHRIA